MASIAPQAQLGFANASSYDAHRPSYSPSAVEKLLSECRVLGKKHARILDLAAGSGKFTELLSARPEEYEILAVEPHEGMREVLEGKGLRGVKVLGGTAEELPFVQIGEEGVDAIFVAQAKPSPPAFHWFATETTLRNLHRILRPHGTLGLIWNIEYYNAPQSFPAPTAWEQKIQDLTWTFSDDQPRFRHMQWKKVFEEQSKSTPLSLLVASEQFFSLPLGEEREEFVTWLGKEGVWERYATISHIAVLEGEKRERTRQVVMDALNSPDVETNEKGEVAVHGLTHLAWTSKIPEDGRESLTDVERPGDE